MCSCDFGGAFGWVGDRTLRGWGTVVTLSGSFTEPVGFFNGGRDEDVVKNSHCLAGIRPVREMKGKGGRGLLP